MCKPFLLIFFGLTCFLTYAQEEDSIKVERDILDSIFIEEFENKDELPKILHAEPLYIDLIRDLGARKGEKEWNVGVGLTDNNRFDEYETLIEYEWAPINRLGLEVEFPFSFYFPVGEDSHPDSIPSNKLQSLKLAAQYTFLVHLESKISLAIGYLHEFETIPFKDFGSNKLYSGNIFNPFLVGAKRWGQNFHTLIYTGPQVFQHFSSGLTTFNWEINSNFHYMIDGTRNFIGIEINKNLNDIDFSMVLRPQMRVSVADNLMVGIVAGIPISSRQNERFSTFLRIIYEPGAIHK